MPKRVQFADEIEPLVQFIEETDPSEIMERTLAQAAGRCVDADHADRLGPCGDAVFRPPAGPSRRSAASPGGPPCRVITSSSAWRESIGFSPSCNTWRSPTNIFTTLAWGRTVLLEFEPVDAGGVEATKEAFLAAVNRGEYNKADHYFLWLWEHVPPVEALDLLLTVAIPKNVLDDHYFIFPAFTWRALEWIGQEYLPVLMRPAVRYVTRFPIAAGHPRDRGAPRRISALDTLPAPAQR